MSRKQYNPLDNLVPQSKRTKDEQREVARKGGIASGIARRRKKLLSQIYADFLAKEHNIYIDGESKNISGSKLAEVVALKILVKFNNSSVSMLKEIREATEGSNVKIDGAFDINYVRNIADEIIAKRNEKNGPSLS